MPCCTPNVLIEVWHRWRALRAALGTRRSACTRPAPATTATALGVSTTGCDVAAHQRVAWVTSDPRICAITTTASAPAIAVAATTRVGGIARISATIATVSRRDVSVHLAVGTALDLVTGRALSTSDGLHFCCATKARELLLLQRSWRCARAAHACAEAWATTPVLARSRATASTLAATAATLT